MSRFLINFIHKFQIPLLADPNHHKELRLLARKGRASEIFHNAAVFARNMTNTVKEGDVFKLRRQQIRSIRCFLEFLEESAQQHHMYLEEKADHSQATCENFMRENGWKHMLENGQKVVIKINGNKIIGVCPDPQCDAREHALSMQGQAIITNNLQRHLKKQHEQIFEEDENSEDENSEDENRENNTDRVQVPPNPRKRFTRNQKKTKKRYR